jgi:hypothetical protein
MSKRETKFDVHPETGDEIDEELEAALDEAIASADRGEGIPLEIVLEEWRKEAASRSK